MNAQPAAAVGGGGAGPTAVSANVERGDGSDDRPVVEAVAADRWSLRVTLDASLKEDVETLRALLSHKVPGGDLAEVLREAVRCGIEMHGKRKGVIAPARSRAGSGRRASGRATRSRAVPATVRREVWARDGGRCTFVAADGRRCESRWQLELDHVEPAARGGEATADNLRLRCRKHNLHYAEQVYGSEHMARFRRASGAASAPSTAAWSPCTPDG